MPCKGLWCYFSRVYAKRIEEATIARAQDIQICFSICKQIGMPTADKFIVELQRRKGASEASWVRKIDNSSSRENFKTSPYERPSPVQTLRARPGVLGVRYLDPF